MKFNEIDSTILIKALKLQKQQELEYQQKQFDAIRKKLRNRICAWLITK